MSNELLCNSKIMTFILTDKKKVIKIQKLLIFISDAIIAINKTIKIANPTRSPHLYIYQEKFNGQFLDRRLPYYNL